MPNTDLTKRSLIINSQQCSYKQHLEDENLKCYAGNDVQRLKFQHDNKKTNDCLEHITMIRQT